MNLKSFNQLANLRNKNKHLKIGLCHGVFDILHNGHIEHFKDAKKMVDILVVSVTSKEFVNKGPRQPLNNNAHRLNILQSLKFIDYTYLNKAKDSNEIIKFLKPNIYFKGLDYLKSDNHGNLKKEINVLKKNNGKIIFTKTKLQSSTKIFNQNYAWTKQQKKYLKNLSNYSFNDFKKIFNDLKEKTINIIGEPIIDKYEYCDIVGTTTKDPAISVLANKSISIDGGVVAVAKMASKFAKKINLITYGDSKILKKLSSEYPNINIINISKNLSIQTKTRFINSNREEKLIQITNFKENKFTIKDEKKCIKELKKIKKQNILICDFGLGLFKGRVLRYINSKSSNLNIYLNVQTNSINLGFNLFTKYNKSEYLSLDAREWSLGLKKIEINFDKIPLSVQNLKFLAATKGKDGSMIKTKNKCINAPVFTKTAKDTTGSGDAFFIISSMLIMLKTDPILIPFIGNVYAGMHAQNLGNMEIISSEQLLSNINSMIKQ